MTKSDADIAAKLKELIDQNGPDYLAAKPYKVYKKLAKSATRGKKASASVLYALVSGVTADLDPAEEPADLSKRIQKECSLNKQMADRLAGIFLSVYSESNRREWENKNQEGLKQFLTEAFTCTWEGFAVWNEGNGSVDCYYKAEVILNPTDKAAENKELVQMLKKNPFMTKETISEYFSKSLRKYLDGEFEEYCTCDDYYQPVVEDFEAEYCVKEWSGKNGFNFISCDGDGYDGGYEPDFRRGWY